MIRFEVVETRGGALAVRCRTTGEVMHPVVGPREEARRLYVEPSGLAARLADGAASSHDAGDGPVVLLDVGLGAGSNAIAAWSVSEGLGDGPRRRLEIVSFDSTTDALALALAPAHAGAFGLEGARASAARAVLERGRHETPRTTWRFRCGELPGVLATEPEASADVVFWDPFSPRANPELWTMTAFAALRRLARPGATVHTYSAATRVRAALLLAGFAVGAGDPTGEKEDTTVAATEVASLVRPLGASWLSRLARSSAPFPTDAPADAMARIASLRQFR